MSLEHERNETPLEEAQRKWGEVTERVRSGGAAWQAMLATAARNEGHPPPKRGWQGSPQRLRRRRYVAVLWARARPAAVHLACHRRQYHCRISAFPRGLRGGRHAAGTGPGDLQTTCGNGQADVQYKHRTFRRFVAQQHNLLHRNTAWTGHKEHEPEL